MLNWLVKLMKMAFQKIICSILLIILITQSSPGQDTLNVSNEKIKQPVASPDTIKLKMTKSPKGAMLRSLIIPGWGQFYNGKWFKGIIIGGTEIGLITNAIIQNQFVVQAETEFEKEFYRENRSLSIWWLGAVILYSITDAFVDAHLYDFDDSPNLSMNMKKEIEPFNKVEYLVITFNLKIPL